MSKKNTDESKNDLNELNLLDSLRIKEKELELELKENNTDVENTRNTRSLSSSNLELRSSGWENIEVSKFNNLDKYAWFSILSQNGGGCLLIFKNNIAGNFTDSAYIKSGWSFDENEIENTESSNSFLALHTTADNNPLTIRNGKVGINLTNDYDEPSNALEVKGTIKISKSESGLQIGSSILDETLLNNVGAWDYTAANYAKFNINKRIEFESVGSVSAPGVMWGADPNYSIIKGGTSWASPNFNQLKLNWVTGIILDPNTVPMINNVPYQKSYVWVKQGLVVGNSYGTYQTSKAKANNLIVEGNVGIGTMAPTKELEVNGNIKLSGNLFKGSTEIELDDYSKLSWLPDPVSDNSKYLRSKTNGTGYELADIPFNTTFLELTDTPNSFTSNKYLKINASGNKIIFADAPSSGSTPMFPLFGTGTGSNNFTASDDLVKFNSTNKKLALSNNPDIHDEAEALLHIREDENATNGRLLTLSTGIMNNNTNGVFEGNKIIFNYYSSSSLSKFAKTSVKALGYDSNHSTLGAMASIETRLLKMYPRASNNWHTDILFKTTKQPNTGIPSSETDPEKTGNLYTMRLQKGNVGIGDFSNDAVDIDAKLEVKGNVKITGRKLRLMNSAIGSAPNDIEFGNLDDLNFIGLDGSSSNKRITVARSTGYLGVYTNTNSNNGLAADTKYIPPNPQANLHILEGGVGRLFRDDNDLQVRVRLQANKNPGQATAQYGEIGFIRSSDAKTTITDISDKNDRGIFLNTNQFRTSTHDFLFNSKGHMSMGFIKTASDAQLHIGNNYNLTSNKGKTGSDDDRICIQIQSTEDTHHSIGNMENKDLYIQADENLRILKQNASKGQTADTSLIINKDGKIGLDTDITGTDYSVQAKNLFCKNNMRIDGELMVKGIKTTFEESVVFKKNVSISTGTLSCNNIDAIKLNFTDASGDKRELTGEKIKMYDTALTNNIAYLTPISRSSPARGNNNVYVIDKPYIKIQNDLYIGNDIIIKGEVLTDTIVNRIKTITGDINTDIRDYYFQKKNITAEQMQNKTNMGQVLANELGDATGATEGVYIDKYMGLGETNPQAKLHIKDVLSVLGGDAGGNRLLVLEATGATPAIKKVDFSLGNKTYQGGDTKSKLMIRFYDNADTVNYRSNPKFQLDEDGRCLFGTGQLEKDIQLKVNGNCKITSELTVGSEIMANKFITANTPTSIQEGKNSEATIWIDKGANNSYIWMRGHQKHELIFAQESGGNKIYSREFAKGENGGNADNGIPLQFRIGNQLVLELKKQQIHLKKDLYNKNGSKYGFLDLLGTPDTFTPNKYLRVNSLGTALEFTTAPTTTSAAPSSGWSNAVGNGPYSAGPVGIGTTSPDRDIHIYKSDSEVGATLKIETDGGGGSNQPTCNIEFDTNDGGSVNPGSASATYAASKIVSGWTANQSDWNESYIAFQTHGTDRAALTNDLFVKGGKVGINTITPSERLEVNGKIKATSLKLGTKELTTAKIQKLDNLPNTIDANYWTKSSENNYTINGNIGINTTTTPSQKLDVNGNINFVGDLYKGGARYNFTNLSGTPNAYTANKYLQVNASGTGLVYVDVPGSNLWTQGTGYVYYNAPVAINTTTMEKTGSSIIHMLEVNGKIKCRTSLTIGSNILLESDITNIKNISTTINNSITKLTNINSTPTQNSANCVSSGGVWSGLSTKQDILTAGNGISIRSNTIHNTIWDTDSRSNDISFNGVNDQLTMRVGIGKVPTEKLDINGNVKINDDIILNKYDGEAKLYTLGDNSMLKLSAGSSDLASYIKLGGGGAGTGSMDFYVSGGEKMSIDNNGNVYIGTPQETVYTEKLQVDGDVKALNFKIDDKILTKSILTSLQGLDGTSILDSIAVVKKNRETSTVSSINTATKSILSNVKLAYVSKTDDNYKSILNKQDILISGNGISIDGNTISSTVIAGLQKKDINGAVSNLVDKNVVRDRIIISDESGKLTISDMTTSYLNLLKPTGLQKTISDGLSDKQNTITASNRINANLIGTGKVGNNELNKLVGLDGDTIKKRFSSIESSIGLKLNAQLFTNRNSDINKKIEKIERSLFTSDKNSEQLQNIEDIKLLNAKITTLTDMVKKVNDRLGMANTSAFWWGKEDTTNRISNGFDTELHKFIVSKQKEFDVEYPFHHCASNGKKNDVIKFLNLGFDVNVINQDGNTALHELSVFGLPNIASLLCSSGADVNKQNIKGQTAMMIALENNNLKMIEFLNNKKVDLDILDNNGNDIDFYIIDKESAIIKEVYVRKHKGQIVEDILKSDNITMDQMQILVEYNKKIMDQMNKFLNN